MHPDLDAVKLEKALWNWTLETIQKDAIPLYWEEPKVRYRYTTKAMSLHFNLTNHKNPRLLETVLGKKLSFVKLLRSSPAQLFPELWDPIFERVAEKQLRKQLTTDVDKVPDGMYQCSRCKSWKTTFTQLQTRSADEPMSSFFFCCNCQKRWRTN